MRGSPSLTLLEWKPGQVPLLSRGSRHWEGEGEGKEGGEREGGLCSLRGVLTGRQRTAPWFRAASGERQESGDSRVARRSAEEMELHQTENSDFSVSKQKKFLSE